MEAHCRNLLRLETPKSGLCARDKNALLAEFVQSVARDQGDRSDGHIFSEGSLKRGPQTLSYSGAGD